MPEAQGGPTGGRDAGSGADHEVLLDATGLICPMPVLKARRALRDMAAGERLMVLATDAAAAQDFVAFCGATGHVLLSAAAADDAGVMRFVIRRGASG